MESDGIRRKLASARPPPETGVNRGAIAAWKLALARAARDALNLDLVVSGLEQNQHSLGELLEMPADLAMLVILEGPQDSLGLLAIAPDVLSALIEKQTIGQISATAPTPRRPTRTDAAMVAGWIDLAMKGLETTLTTEQDLSWASNYRYASFLDDIRPLGLLLEDVSYQVLKAEISIASNQRKGLVFLALPAATQSAKTLSPPPASLAEDLVFKTAMQEQVFGSDTTLNGVLARLTLPLQAILDLKPGDPLLLGQAALSQIDLEGVDGCRLAGGKLGQNRGMRAIRLCQEAAPAARIKFKAISPEMAPKAKASAGRAAS